MGKGLFEFFYMSLESKVLFDVFLVDGLSDVWEEFVFAHELKQPVEFILIGYVLQ